MADLINEVVAPEVPKEITEVTDLLVKLVDQINVAAAAGKTIQFEFKGLNDLASLTDLLNQAQGVTTQMQQVTTQLNTAQQQASNISSQYSASTKEMVDNLVQQKLELNYVNEQIKTFTKVIQEGKGNQDQANEVLSEYTKRQQELKVEIGATTSAIKSEIKEIQAATGSMDQMSQSLFQLKERYRALSAEERNNIGIGGVLANQIQKLDLQVKELDKTIGNSQRNVGNYGSAFQSAGQKITQFFTRDLLRGIAGFFAFSLIMQPVINGITAIGDAIVRNIPGTDAYIKRQQDLATSLQGTHSALVQQISDLEQLKTATEDYLGIGEDAYKRQADAVKAMGVANGEVYEAERKQIDAQKEAIDKHISDLDNQAAKYQAAFRLFSQIDKGGDLNRIRGEFAGLGFTETELNKFNATIDEFLKKRESLSDDEKKKFKLADNEDLTKKRGEIENATKNLSQQKIDLESQLQARLNALTTQKNLELEKQLMSVHEQFRQATEKEDADSLDKIVNDIKAKYGLAIKDIEINMRELAKNYPDHILPDDVKGKYETLISLLKEVGDQEQKNAAFENQQSLYKQGLQNTASLSAGAAGIAAGNSAFGIPSYDKLTSALDAQTQAKKDALAVEFENEAAKYQEGDGKIIELQEQFRQREIQIDRDAYKQRLSLVDQYFSSVNEKINTATASLLTEDKARALNLLTGIISGGGSVAQRDARAQLASLDNRRSQAEINLSGARSQLPGAQEAYTRATNATAGPLSPDALEEATKVQAQMKRQLDDLKLAEAQASNEIANVDFEKNKLREDAARDLKDRLINLASETVSAIKTIQDNQIDHELQQLDIKQNAIRMQSQQEQDAINAKTEDKVSKDNELAALAARTAAQENEIQHQKNQLSIKKAKADKEAAIAGIIMSTAAAEAQALAYLTNPITAPLYPAIAAVIATTGAVQLAAAASAPIPQYRFGTKDHKGGLAIIGEAKEPEYVTTPTGQSFWSKPEATLFNLPKHSTVTPLHQVMQFANNNIVSGSGELQKAESKRSENIAILMMGQALGKKFEQVGNDIAWGIARSNRKPTIIINTKDNDLQVS
jgi:hypothetical protein